MSKGSPARLRRGLILLTLLEQYPGSLARAILERNMGPAYYGRDAERDFDRDMAYLEDSGYIEHERQSFGAHVLEAVKVTPKGIDVAERSVEDPGVEFAS